MNGAGGWLIHHPTKPHRTTLHRALIGQAPTSGHRGLVGWPLPLGFGLGGRLLPERRGRVCVKPVMIITKPHPNSQSGNPRRCWSSWHTSTRRVIRAISLCDGRRTCTARRRGVALALATPTSANTNRVVRIGNGPSSEFGKSCDTNVVLFLLTPDINYFL